MAGKTNPDNAKDIISKYQKKLEGEIDVNNYASPSVSSQDYQVFRKEALTRNMSLYEFLCNLFGKIATIKPNKKDAGKIEESIKTTHIQITPDTATGFAVFVAFFIILIGIIIFLLKYSVAEAWSLNTNLTDLLIPLFFALVGVLLVKPISSIPNYMATRWRLRASNQMVLCILYIVIYMRHTSNLENALRFASEHIGDPLALDLKKVFWDVESGKFSTIKQSLEGYLEQWKDHSLEFVESFHLIQGSLYEANEDRRITILEKALDVILEGTYEKMLHYAQNLKSPITMLHMLGIILPILGLVILPLVGSLMPGSGTSKAIIFSVLYLILFPGVVYAFGTNILSKRPTGYSETNLLQEKQYEKHKNIVINLGNKQLFISPLLPAIFIFILVSSIGLVPLLMHAFGVDFPFIAGNLIDYKQANGIACEAGKICYGPFGAGAVILSLFFPLGIILSLGFYHKIRTKNLIKIRNQTKKLEVEFSGSLFQLGSRVGDGIPVELGFEEVSRNMRGTPTGDFFAKVSSNMRALGVGMKEAIFGKTGAIWKYPSSLIHSTMKVLIESARKGPSVVSKSLMSVSSYVRDIHKVNERLKDILSDVISSMKSQINFLTPIIAGIVIGISTMIVTILTRLSESITLEATESAELGGLPVETLGQLFEIPNIIPSYFLQLIVGLYVIEIIFLLTKLSNSIEYGSDEINEKYSLGKNLYIGGLLYFFVALFVTIIFTFLSMAIAPMT